MRGAYAVLADRAIIFAASRPKTIPPVIILGECCKLIFRIFLWLRCLGDLQDKCVFCVEVGGGSDEGHGGLVSESFRPEL